MYKTNIDCSFIWGMVERDPHCQNQNEVFGNEPLSNENSTKDLPDLGRKLIPNPQTAFSIHDHCTDPSAHNSNGYEIFVLFHECMHFIVCSSPTFTVVSAAGCTQTCNVYCQLIYGVREWYIFIDNYCTLGKPWQVGLLFTLALWASVNSHCELGTIISHHSPHDQSIFV